MKIIKDEHLGLLTRVFSHKNCHFLTGTAVLAFKLGAGAEVLAEDELWKLAAEALDPGQALDFGLLKPKGELMVAGWCFADQGQPVTTLEAGFRLGTINKKIRVFGDRYWLDQKSARPTTPIPFTNMKICWEKAFGGPDYGLNPLGRGFGPQILPSGEVVFPLPNLEDPAHLITSPRDRPQPVSLGPLGTNWPDRLSNLGTFDQQWMQQCWPGLPDDFDFGFFNLAPHDQRINRFFNQNEALTLWRLHEHHPELTSNLPGLKARLFMRRKNDFSRNWSECQPNLDTIWLFPHLLTGILIWHGLFKVEDDEAGDVAEFMAVLDPLTGTFLTAVEHEARLTISEVEVQPASPEKTLTSDSTASVTSAEPQAALVEAHPGQQDETIALLEKQIQETKQRLNDYLRQMGVDPEEPLKHVELPWLRGEHASLAGSPPPEAAPEQLLDFYQKQTAQAKLMLKNYLGEMGVDTDALAGSPKNPPYPTFEEVVAFVGSLPGDSSELIAELKKLSQAETLARREMEDLLSQAQRQIEAPLESVNLADDQLKIVETIASSVVLTKAVEERLEAGLGLVGMNLTGQDMRNFKLAGIDLSAAVLEKANLSGLDLSGTNFSGAILTGADLSGAKLSEAKLLKAKMSSLKMTDADMTGADLSGADLTNADLRGAILTRAILINTDLSGASLSNTKAAGARGDGALFVGADLTQADFSKSCIVSADLSEARLGRADFCEADLQGAWFSDVKATEVNFRKANLTGSKAEGQTVFNKADFTEAILSRAYFENADFFQANLSKANLTGATFTGCLFHQATLTKAEARQADLTKSDLTEADLRGINLMEGSLRKANLSGTDLRGANIFAVDVYKCIMGETNLERANLKRTLLTIIKDLK